MTAVRKGLLSFGGGPNDGLIVDTNGDLSSTTNGTNGTASEFGQPIGPAGGIGGLSADGTVAAASNIAQGSATLAGAAGLAAAAPMQLASGNAASAGVGDLPATAQSTGTPGYSTTFMANENPISGGGNWLHTPNAWATIQTSGGHAVSNQGTVWGTNDAYAYMAGTWANDQSAEATIWETGQNGEVEILLRASDTATQAEGYELNVSMDGTYSQIAVWLGPYNQGSGVSYEIIHEMDTFPSGMRPLATGDVILGEISGTTINLYVNQNDGKGFQLINTATDSTYASGSPGIALNRFSDPSQDFGFSAFEAWGNTAGSAVTEALVSDTGTPGDRLTSNDALTGMGDANAVVTLTEGSTTLGTTTVNAAGAWTFTPSSLSQGSHTIVANETDPAGDTGVASLTFTYDTIAPGVTEALASDTGGSSTDQITTNDTLTGTGDANAVVTLTEGGTTLGSTTANAGGSWSFTPAGLSQGSRTILASETDLSGNTGSASLSLIYDTVGPTVASVATSGNGITNGTGSLRFGATVTLTVTFSDPVLVTGAPSLSLNDGATAAYQSGSGSSALTFLYTVAAGQNTSDLTVTAFNLNKGTARDIAGNNAITAGAVTNPTGILRIDNTPPTVTIGLARDTGKSTTDRITSNDALSGSGDPSATVTLMENGNSIGTVTASATGAWTFTPVGLAQGSHRISASETDGAGNIGTASLTFSYDFASPAVRVPTPATAGLGALEGSGSSLTASTVIATFTASGGLAGDSYSFALGGAGSFALSTSGPTATLTSGGKAVPGTNGGRVYALTVTATDTTSGVAAAAIPVDIVVGSNTADTINLASGAGNFGLTVTTPSFIYGQGGNDTLNASGMTAPVGLAGGAGADTMTGGSGTNTYLYGAIGDSSRTLSDLITNFVVTRDLLDFSGLGSAIKAYQGQVALNASVDAHGVAWAVNSATQQTIVYANTGNSAGVPTMQVNLVGTNLGFAAPAGPNDPGITL